MAIWNTAEYDDVRENVDIWPHTVPPRRYHIMWHRACILDSRFPLSWWFYECNRLIAAISTMLMVYTLQKGWSWCIWQYFYSGEEWNKEGYKSKFPGLDNKPRVNKLVLNDWTYAEHFHLWFWLKSSPNVSISDPISSTPPAPTSNQMPTPPYYHSCPLNCNILQ